jgi:hypothetical protein
MLAVYLAFPCALIAQSTNAALTGFVDDPSKSIIPGVSITAINTETGVRTTTTTNRSGQYVLSGLIPGAYRLEVDKQGFKGIIDSGLILHVQDVIQLNFHMAVGSMSETVTVNGTTATINTTDGSVSTVIDRDFVENIPLNGRSFQSLLFLTPGVVPAQGAGPGSTFAFGQFNVNGQRASSNYWMVDGVSANVGTLPSSQPGNGAAGGVGATNVLGGTNGLVSVDAVQEFRMETSSYAPEFGRTVGGQISILTRSGTNQFHGTVFDYFRNDALDANYWFNGYTNTTPLRKAPERQNDFGGTVGGPIFKDKTFFFFSYEGLRLRLPLTAYTTVPDLAARQAAIPAMQPYLNSFPLPNPGAVDVGTGIAPFNASFSEPSTINAYSGRVDHALTKKINIFGRYDYSPSVSDARAKGFFSANSPFVLTSNLSTFTAGATWEISPQMVNEARFNYSHSTSTYSSSIDNFGGAVPVNGSTLFPAGLTYNNGYFDFYDTFGTQMSLSSGYISGNQQTQYNVVDALSMHKGSHDLKFGFDYRRLSPLLAPKVYSLEPIFTSISGLESGTPLFTFQSNQVQATILFHNLGVFAQDTWHVNPRLTMTYGMRWDVDYAPYLQGTSYSLPAVTGYSPTSTANLALAPAGTPIYNTHYGDFAPRVGIAYQINNSESHALVLRGGFGVYYDLASTEVGNYDASAYPLDSTQNNFTAPFPTPPSAAMQPAIVAPNATNAKTLVAFNPNLNEPYTLQWSAALEQALGKDQTISFSYVGSSGSRLLASEFLTNAAPNFVYANLIDNQGSSNYEALQLQFKRRLAAGFQTLVSYSWSHSIDTSSYGEYYNGSFAGLNANRGNSDFDIRNVLSAALTYKIPALKANRLTREILGGWSTEDILQVHSAPPVDVIDGKFSVLATQGYASVRPDVVAGQPLYLYNSKYPGSKALNPSAFMDPPTASGVPTRQGTLGRNYLRAFGLTQLDFGVHRDFNIYKETRLQFRAEMFNIFNHPNFAPYDTSFGTGDPYFGMSKALLDQGSSGSSPGAGGLDSLYALGGPRSIQLALKIFF